MFKKQYIEWDVPIAQVQIGIPVGYEVELALNYAFHPVTYNLTTFDEDAIADIFFYSLDDGGTWIDYPLGDAGKIFTTAYKMRVAVDFARSNFIFSLNDNIVSQIRPDCHEVLQSFTIEGSGNFDSIEVNDYFLSLLRANILVRYSVKDLNISPYQWSLNLNSTPLCVSIDDARQTLWQIDNTKFCLKDWEGNSIFCEDLPFEIDVNFSSSSSSSSSSSLGYSSSSSSSSVGYSSSSSSSSSSSVGYSSSSSSSVGYSSSSSSSIDSSSSSSSSYVG